MTKIKTEEITEVLNNHGIGGKLEKNTTKDILSLIDEKDIQSQFVGKSKGTIRILIEIPENWVDLDSPIGFVSHTAYQMVQREIKDVLMAEYIKNAKMPDVKITRKELKEAILNKMAEQAINKINE